MRREPRNGARRDDDHHVSGPPRRPEHGVSAVASGQHGVITRTQLRELGFGPRAIDRRLESGSLHLLHRGVYLVGHRAATQRAHELAAVLACGPEALLSSRSATHFWSLLPYPANPGPIDVTVVGRNRRSRPGIRLLRTDRIDRSDWLVRDAIPVVKPARALLELAALASEPELERAIAEGIVRRIVTRGQLADQLARNPRRAGTRLLRRLLDDGAAPTRSEAERRLLGLLRAAALPEPEVNARVAGFEVDLLWRRERLVVEVDGYRFHSSRRAFERDRARDATLAAAGYAVVRITWRQLERGPEAVVARIAAALAVRA